jgi:hypothetical protein
MKRTSAPNAASAKASAELERETRAMEARLRGLKEEKDKLFSKIG